MAQPGEARGHRVTYTAEAWEGRLLLQSGETLTQSHDTFAGAWLFLSAHVRARSDVVSASLHRVVVTRVEELVAAPAVVV